MDTFRVTVIRPADDSLFRDAHMMILTPTGSVETAKIKPAAWRLLTNEQLIRDYVEERLIAAFPARRNLWHGSTVKLHHEGTGTFTVVEVDSDHFDGGYRPYDPS